jgi:hypothetical protein
MRVSDWNCAVDRVFANHSVPMEVRSIIVNLARPKCMNDACEAEEDLDYFICDSCLGVACEKCACSGTLSSCKVCQKKTCIRCEWVDEEERCRSRECDDCKESWAETEPIRCMGCGCDFERDEVGNGDVCIVSGFLMCDDCCNSDDGFEVTREEGGEFYGYGRDDERFDRPQLVISESGDDSGGEPGSESGDEHGGEHESESGGE